MSEYKPALPKLSLSTLRKANIKRLTNTAAFSKCETWRTTDWFAAMIGEAGEFANLNKKIDRGDFSIETVREDLGKELADVMIYLDLLAHHIGIDLESAVRDKFNEVSTRVGASVYIVADFAHEVKKNA